jgi:hypothetical protein
MTLTVPMTTEIEKEKKVNIEAVIKNEREVKRVSAHQSVITKVLKPQAKTESVWVNPGLISCTFKLGFFFLIKMASYTLASVLVRHFF